MLRKAALNEAHSKVLELKNVELKASISKLGITLAQIIKNRAVDGLGDVEREADKLRRLARQNRNGDLANEAWLLMMSANCWDKFCEIFQDIKKNLYRPSWDKLERVEIECYSILRNFPNRPDYKIRELLDTVHRWQKLYPYKVFASPEFLINKEECSICGKANDPWQNCGHEAGKLYHGVVAHRIVKEGKILGISLVTDPVQKYSVLIMSTEDGSDPSDYSLLSAVSSWLDRPYDRWSIEWTTRRHPHHLFSSTLSCDPCPCRSGRMYEQCCLPTEGVLKPHCNVKFEVQPQNEPPKISYLGYPTEAA